MDDNASELLKRGDARFSARSQLETFWQEVSLNFCPWHSFFTTSHVWGEDYASNLIDGTPMLLGRDFVGQLASMLRPAGKQWFWHRSEHDSINNDIECREYLDWRSRQQMRIMFDRVSGASRALKMADEFFGFFGNAAMSVDLSPMRDSIGCSGAAAASARSMTAAVRAGTSASQVPVIPNTAPAIPTRMNRGAQPELPRFSSCNAAGCG